MFFLFILLLMSTRCMTNLITKQPAYVSLKVVDHVAIFYKLLKFHNQ